MKEMAYSFERIVEVLERNFYKDYEYLIINYGTHPCCYVALRKSHPCYEVHDDNINCHGGITYCGHGLIDHFTRTTYLSEDYWVMGWDYQHFGDFSGYYLNPANRNITALCRNSKKWTTLELIKDCKDVIKQLDFLDHPERKYA